MLKRIFPLLVWAFAAFGALAIGFGAYIFVGVQKSWNMEEAEEKEAILKSTNPDIDG